MESKIVSHPSIFLSNFMPVSLNHFTSHPLGINYRTVKIPFNIPNRKNQAPIKIPNSLSSSVQSSHEIVYEFDPSIPVEEALTPPSSWYFDPSFYSLELDHVFYRGWRVVGCTDQIKNAHDYFTGRLGNMEYVICRDGDGKIHAFHNVCRHHASVLAYGSGRKTCFVCPYHGWTYGLEGDLLKAPRITGLQNFNPKVCSNIRKPNIMSSLLDVHKQALAR
ncbi:Choline monooxygenase chloroplastic [Bienertia sinuspersici]